MNALDEPRMVPVSAAQLPDRMYHGTDAGVWASPGLRLSRLGLTRDRAAAERYAAQAAQLQAMRGRTGRPLVLVVNPNELQGVVMPDDRHPGGSWADSLEATGSVIIGGPIERQKSAFRPDPASASDR